MSSTLPPSMSIMAFSTPGRLSPPAPIGPTIPASGDPIKAFILELEVVAFEAAPKAALAVRNDALGSRLGSLTRISSCRLRKVCSGSDVVATC
jgi:hypothetical protein